MEQPQQRPQEQASSILYRPQQSFDDGGGNRKSNNLGSVELMSIDQCENIREMDDLRLVRAPETVNSVDADVASKDSGCSVADGVEMLMMMKNSENYSSISNNYNNNISNKPCVDEKSTGKRRRGRPPRNQAAGAAKAKALPPPSRKQAEEEDVCFICFDGGSLVLCDYRGCPKAYHPACIKRDEAFFRSKAKWNCGWHICNDCRRPAHYMCYTCTYSLCKACTKGADYVNVRGTKGFCGTCMKTIMLIENSAQGNGEMVQVDFDDKGSWEYLFKVYWLCLKGKLSLTLDELTRAKNPWKETGVVASRVESTVEVRDGNDGKGCGSDISCANMDTNLTKRRKANNQPKDLNKGHCPSIEKSDSEKVTLLPEGPKWATKELMEFVAHVKNGDTSMMSQFDLRALLLEYIKRNNLHDPQQKCQIICDSRLTSLFGKARVGHIEMLKLLEYHLLVNRTSPSVETIKGGIVCAVASQTEANDSIHNQLMMGNDKKGKTHKRADYKAPLANPAECAAINFHNINLIYLRRNLMENLIDDIDKFQEKVVGSIVRIRISGGDQKQEAYRLVQVLGTSKASEPYKIGSRTTDTVLEILNLDKKELVPIDELSNQEFSEDECLRLRRSIKCGLNKQMKVGEIQEKAAALQALRVNDWLEAEVLRLNHLRDRASEKGRRKELRECVEKLQLLNSPEERQRRLLAIPEVDADPKMDPNYDSEEDAASLHDKKQDDNKRRRNSGVGRKERGSISSQITGDDLNKAGSRAQKYPSSTCQRSENTCTTYYVDKEGAIHTHGGAIESSWNTGRETIGISIWNSPKNQVGPIGTGNTGWNNQGAVRSEVISAVTSETSPGLSTGTEQSISDIDVDKLWHYRDPMGKIQGPFPLGQLRKWSVHFPPDLRVWRINASQDDSILLTDALQGHCGQDSPSVLLQAQEIRAGPDERDKSLNVEWTRSVQATHVDSEHGGGWNSTQNDASTPGDLADSKGQTQNVSVAWDSLKGNDSLPGQPQVGGSLPLSTFSVKCSDTSTLEVSESHKDEKWNSGESEMIGNLPKISDGRTDTGDENEKRPDCEVQAGQSPGRNGRPQPIGGSSTNWDSNPGIVSVAESLETSAKNENIGLPSLPSSTQNPGNEDLTVQATDVRHSRSPDVPVQDSGPSWSSASSLVAGGTQLPEVAGEWGGYSTTPAKPVEEWDSNTSSHKPARVATDHAATPTSGIGQLTHSSPSHPAPDASNWQAMVAEATDFTSLVDESVSDLLAEVEAMESLNGLSSPTSAMRPQDSENDCFSPLEGLSPARDPGKSDANSSTTDLHAPSQLTVTDEPVGVSQGDILYRQQKHSGGCSSSSADAEDDAKPSDVSVNQHEMGCDIQHLAPSSSSSGYMATTDVLLRLGPENRDAKWGAVHGNVNSRGSGLSQGGTSMDWGTVPAAGGAAAGHPNLNLSTPYGDPGIWGNQPRYGGDRFTSPRERDFYSRDSGFGRNRSSSWNRQQQVNGGANGGGYYRPPPKGQRVCKFYESGYCKKGASCSYWHP